MREKHLDVLSWHADVFEMKANSETP